MRIFITGGTGFIGPYIVKELEKEGNTLLLLSPEPKTADNIINGNLSNINQWQNKVKDFQPQATIHMAWESIPNYDSKTSIKNLKYGLELITMLAELGCKRVICTGSCWEYGQQTGKLSEDMAIKPFTAFTAAKNALHWLGREIARENGMQFIWTRLFYVYGPRQREGSLIPYIINSVRKGKKPEIKTPSTRNDFIYVGDVARAIAAILKHQGSGTYNIGSGHSTSIQEIIEIIYNGFNLKYDAVNNSQDDSVANFWADISKIKKDTGWEPKIGIKEGIQKTVDYYKNI